MKYLETMNPMLFQRTKAVITECCERHQKQESGFDNVSVDCLRKKLKSVVDECYWNRVEAYHKRFMARRRKEQRMAECMRMASQVFGKEP